MAGRRKYEPLQDETAATLGGASSPCCKALLPGAVQLLRDAEASYLDDRTFVFRSTRPFIYIDRERVGLQPAAERKSEVRLSGRLGWLFR